MRFTIRDLLWLTGVVALGVGWWVDRAQLAAQSVERDRLWKEAVTKSLSRVSLRTGQPVSIKMPDGEVIGWIPNSFKSQAQPPNPPKK